MADDYKFKKRVAERITNEIYDLHPARILVVDDEEMLRRYFKEILELSGFEVDTAQDAFNAERLCLRKSFDTIFSDIAMPEMNGIELLEKIKATQPETPVIMVTGMPSVDTAANALRLGAYDYLTKPVSREVLVSSATRAVETKRLRQEKRRLEKENLAYQANLENLVEKRTHGLRRQKELLENILESLTHPFYVVNANDYTIKMANSAAKPGYAMAEGLTCHLLAHNRNEPCGCKDHPCPLEQAKKTKQPVCVEDVHFDNKGNARTVEVHAYPLFDGNANVVQVILYEIDISERKRLESIAEATNLMDNIGYVFSGIRHEIGNPINSLKMTLSVLNKNLDTFEKKTVREFTERSLNEVSRVEYLLRTLRNFSLFERPKVQNVRVELFLEKFLPLVSKDLENMRIGIKTMFSSDDIWALTDPRALQQVLLNLVTNAADACEDREGSEIVIEICKKRGLITIAVKDNGCGMTEGQQQELFKPFFTSKAKGTGLGLVIVKKMLTAMKTTVDIESRENEGTTVTMFLPEGDGES